MQRKRLDFGSTSIPDTSTSRGVRPRVSFSARSHCGVSGHRNIDILQTISKADVYALFMTKAHPSSKTRSKLSVHLQSQKKLEHVSLAAASTFAGALKQAEIPVDDEKWKQSLFADGEPTVPDFGKYWKAEISADTSKATLKLLNTLQDILKQHPTDKDAESRLPEVASLIDDPMVFKKSLNVSSHPYPVVEWNDLPVSRI